MSGLEEYFDFIKSRWNKAKQTINENIDKESEALSPKECKKPTDIRVGWLTKTDRINRVEVIDEKGRSYVNWKKDNKVHVAFQDEGRTLKIFINTLKP